MTAHEKLAAVHKAVRQPTKDSVNPHFNSEFASLGECLRVVRAAVDEVGDCGFFQRIAHNADAGEREVQTVFYAGDEELLLSAFPFKSDANPQKAASASTYARRYSLMSAFNLAAEDDDGNGAARPPDSAGGAGEAKKRMWEAVKAYAGANGRDPMEVLAEMQKEKGWREDADYFEMKAMELEEAVGADG